MDLPKTASPRSVKMKGMTASIATYFVIVSITGGAVSALEVMKAFGFFTRAIASLNTPLIDPIEGALIGAPVCDGEPAGLGDELESALRLAPQEAQNVASSALFAPHLGQNKNGLVG